MANQFLFSVYEECCGDHAHDFPQILVPLKETLEITIGALEYHVPASKLCYIPPRMNHRCCFFGDIIAINLPDAKWDKEEARLLAAPLIIPYQGQMAGLMALIQQELLENPDSSHVHHLYHYLYGKLMEHCTSASIRHIHAHFSEPIRMEELAALENYNTAYFQSWFKKQTGLSPGLYLRYVRISRARELLLKTNFSVMEIALMTGYSSNATFTRAFHEVTGVSPVEFRGKRNP